MDIFIIQIVVLVSGLPFPPSQTASEPEDARARTHECARASVKTIAHVYSRAPPPASIRVFTLARYVRPEPSAQVYGEKFLAYSTRVHEPFTRGTRGRSRDQRPARG